jgi:hypothetical protein
MTSDKESGIPGAFIRVQSLAAMPHPSDSARHSHATKDSSFGKHWIARIDWSISILQGFKDQMVAESHQDDIF